MLKIFKQAEAVDLYYSKYYLAEHKKYFSPKRTSQEVQFLIDNLGKNPESVCDIACGDGHHLQKFFSLGVKRGLGIEPNKTLAAIAQKAFVKNPNYDLVKSNFASWQPKEKFDLVYTLFSSIHYCLINEEAQDLINKMVEATNKNGLIVIDSDNIFRLIGFLEAQYISNEYESITFDPKTMILSSNQKTPDGILKTEQRYYLATEFKFFLQKAGIESENIKFFGDFKSSRYSLSSDRLIVTAKK